MTTNKLDGIHDSHDGNHLDNAPVTTFNGKSLFVDLDRQPFRKKRDRVEIKSVTGKNAQICVIRLHPGERSNHQHSQEQLGYVLKGTIQITIGDQCTVLQRGAAYWIPGEVRHAFETCGTEPAEYLEVFCPPKEENVA